jgi:hypothetical protein
MVLLAAVAVAVALAPLLFAYLQLGYHPEVAEPRSDHARDVERTLERELVDATAGVPGTYGWSDRTAAARTVRTRLAPTFEALNRSAVARSTLIQVSYNRSLAHRWAAANCPGGPDRQFGPCEVDGGIVLQERAGRTHVIAVGVDVRIRSSSLDVASRRLIRR